VTTGRDLDRVARVAAIADESKGGIAAAELAAGCVDHARACAMNGMKFNLVEAFLQFSSPTVAESLKYSLVRVRAEQYGASQIVPPSKS
jgi:hypothetical protein